MVKRCIGIDIGRSHLRAVQIAHTPQDLCIEKVFSAPTRRSEDSPPEILRQLAGKHGFDENADVAISMPHDAVFFRSLETDFDGLQQIRQRTRSALEYSFPMEPDDMIAQAPSYLQLPGQRERYSVLTAAVSKESLRDRLNFLSGANIHPNLVEADIFAIHSTVIVNHSEMLTSQAVIAYIDESHLTLAVTESSNILIVRNIPIVSQPDDNIDSFQVHIAKLLKREVQVSWRKVFDEDIEPDSKVYLAIGGNLSHGLQATIKEKLPCEIITVEPYAGLKCLPEHNGDDSIAVAEGLALRALAPDKTIGMNFLRADNEDTRPALELKKELTICAVLVAAIALVSFIGLLVQLSFLENKYAKTKNQIREIFRRTLPEETNIVNPLAQLDQKLQSFRADHRLSAHLYPNALTPLKVLHSITVNTPPDGNIKIDDLLITSESARLRGSCTSFESVYRWQGLLQDIPGFTLVSVQDVQKDTKSDAIYFTVLISLATQEQR